MEYLQRIPKPREEVQVGIILLKTFAGGKPSRAEGADYTAA